MSDFNTILVCISDSVAGLAPLKMACDLGSVFNSHIEALHVKVNPIDVIPYSGESVSGVLIAEMMLVTEKDAKENASKSKEMFEDFCKEKKIKIVDNALFSKKVSALWHEEKGCEDEIVANRAMLRDIVILGRPKTGRDIPSLTTFNASLLEGGRPVLVVPSKNEAKVTGGKVGIAWNGSVESARAVSSAVPILQKANEIIIFVAEEPKDDFAYADDVKEYLELKGIKSEIKRITQEGNSIGEMIISASKKENIDILVTGAYTHSRVRRLILGGVTRYLLDNADIPVFMCH